MSKNQFRFWQQKKGMLCCRHYSKTRAHMRGEHLVSVLSAPTILHEVAMGGIIEVIGVDVFTILSGSSYIISNDKAQGCANALRIY